MDGLEDVLEKLKETGFWISDDAPRGLAHTALISEEIIGEESFVKTDVLGTYMLLEYQIG
jgi:dTDP-D-glucose 4,6-dehydratase